MKNFHSIFSNAIKYGVYFTKIKDIHSIYRHSDVMSHNFVALSLFPWSNLNRWGKRRIVRAYTRLIIFISRRGADSRHINIQFYLFSRRHFADCVKIYGNISYTVCVDERETPSLRIHAFFYKHLAWGSNLPKKSTF